MSYGRYYWLANIWVSRPYTAGILGTLDFTEAILESVGLRGEMLKLQLSYGQIGWPKDHGSQYKDSSRAHRIICVTSVYTGPPFIWPCYP